MLQTLRPHCSRHGRAVLFSAQPARAGQRLLVRSAATAPAPSVLITGASTGIGRETAELLAGKGWHVFAGVRDPDAAAALQHAGGGSITPLTIDVRQQDTIGAAASAVREACTTSGSPLLGLVNNAGKVVLAPAEGFPLDAFRDLLETNLVGVLAVTQAFAPLLREGAKTAASAGAPSSGAAGAAAAMQVQLPPSGHATIVNISSVAGSMGLPLFGAYSASKWGLDGLGECMRYEFAPQGIRVVTIKPGPVRTPIWQRGRVNTTAALAGWRPGTEERYSDLMGKMNAEVDRSEAGGMEPSVVADAVLQALTADNPRAKVVLARDSAATLLLKRLLPHGAWEAVIMRRLSKL